MNDAPRTDETPETAQLRPPALALERYRPYLEDSRLTDDEADELLTALWNVMVQFVDLGFDVRSVHRYLGMPIGFVGDESGEMIQSDDPNENLTSEEERAP